MASRGRAEGKRFRNARRGLSAVRQRTGPEWQLFLAVLIELWNGEMIPVSQERALMVLPGISLKRETVAPSGLKTKVSVRPSA